MSEDNPYASPQTSSPFRARPERNLIWHLLFNPFHPISYGVPLGLFVLVAVGVLIALLSR